MRDSVPIFASLNPADPPLFHKMTADAFEEMCCALLAKEKDIISADRYGRPHDPQFGIDIIGRINDNIRHDTVSCKCYVNIRKGKLSEWSNEFLNHWDVQWKDKGVRRFILAIAADMTSSERMNDVEVERNRFKNIKIEYEVWSPRQLLEKLRQHPGVVAHYLGNEWVKRICGISEYAADNLEQLLEKRKDHCRSCDFEKAVEYSERAVLLAIDLNHKEFLLQAHEHALKDLEDLLASQRKIGIEVRWIAPRIAFHLDRLGTLGFPEDILALEHAIFASLENRANDALQFARKAESITESLGVVAQALFIQLQACWQLQMIQDALGLRAQIENVTTALADGDEILVLQAGWLQTLCKASKNNESDTQKFLAIVRRSISNERSHSAFVMTLLNQISTEFRQANKLSEMRLILEFSLELSVSMSDYKRIAMIAIQSAEVESEIANESGVENFIGLAISAVESLRKDNRHEAYLFGKANLLASRGGIYHNLAEKLESIHWDRSVFYCNIAYDALQDAEKFITDNHPAFKGDIELLRLQVCLNLGRTAISLGRADEAVNWFRSAKTEYAKSDDKLFCSIYVKAILGEANSLFKLGRVSSVVGLMRQLVESSHAPEDSKIIARNTLCMINDSVNPVCEYFECDHAKQITEQVANTGLHRAISAQMHSLQVCLEDIPVHQEDEMSNVYACMIEQWGRGGFARVATATRAEPLNVISIDVYCIEDIVKAARIFCLLYDTVIVTWKGELNPGITLFPISGRTSNSGLGYTVLNATSLVNEQDLIALGGWSNLLPYDVAKFLCNEARSLLLSGRLVIVPAQLVGCTQSLCGWTDNLLLDYFMGGVVKAVRDSEVVINTANDRHYRLGGLSLPYIDNISLDNMKTALDEIEEFLSPFRRLIRNIFDGGHLRQERWGRLGPDFNDIRDGIRSVNERLSSIVRLNSDHGWTISNISGNVSAIKRRLDMPGSDSLTDLLRIVTSNQSDLGPWIPLWQFQSVGAKINWIHPLDNRSTPPPSPLVAAGIDSAWKGWLYPGCGGPHVRAMVKIE